jgi:PAS domain S-box-containing protein
MPSAHCVSSLHGVILQADRGFFDLVQRSEQEVIGLSYKDLTDPRDLQRSQDMLAILEDGAAPVRLQKRYMRPDGSSIAANLLVTRFSHPDRLISTLFWQDNGRALPPARLWEAALRIQHVQASRIKLLGKVLSTDPVGLILITIYLAEAEGRNVEIRDIAASADIAMSTAERWVKALQAEGMVEAGTDPALGVQLTRLGIEKMEAMLAAVYEVPDAALTVA